VGNSACGAEAWDGGGFSCTVSVCVVRGTALDDWLWILSLSTRGRRCGAEATSGAGMG